MTLNRLTIIGNVGQDPELKYTQAGSALLNFSVAVTEKWKDKSGERKERTEWFRCTVWGKRAEALANIIRKGMQLCVEGRMQSQEWEKDGAKRTSWTVNADNIVLLGGGKRAEVSQPDAAPADDGADVGSEDAGDIPF